MLSGNSETASGGSGLLELKYTLLPSGEKFGSDSLQSSANGASSGFSHRPSSNFVIRILFSFVPLGCRVNKISRPHGDTVSASSNSSVDTMPLPKTFGVLPGGVSPKYKKFTFVAELHPQNRRTTAHKMQVLVLYPFNGHSRLDEPYNDLRPGV